MKDEQHKHQKPGQPEKNPQKPAQSWPEKKPQYNPHEKDKYKK